MQAELTIKKWGNSLGVRLPAGVARAAGLRVEQRIRITVHAGKVVLTAVPAAPMSLAERLAKFDPARHGGEAHAVAPVGNERI